MKPFVKKSLSFVSMEQDLSRWCKVFHPSKQLHTKLYCYYQYAAVQHPLLMNLKALLKLSGFTTEEADNQWWKS